ncbi:MAG: tRNA pseudouridine(55) synthase TruB [Elusimicrobia bacterium]|nr:tRNA pseudouridine(55) synthase TruB [Elusimicrobiota bacterium]
MDPHPEAAGLLNIHKPTSLTSFDVIRKVRSILELKRVGHCGTLDPLATGVLLVLFGRATSLASQLVAGEKIYRATMTLGVQTDTGDCTGSIIQRTDSRKFSEVQIRSALKQFEGEIQQTPPIYSAIKWKGRRSYEYARMGIEVPRPPRFVRIDSIDLLNFSESEIELRILCSKGTYIRSLVEEVGTALGTCATVSGLIREKVGHFSLEGSIPWNELLRMDRNQLLYRSIPTATILQP